MKRKYIVGIGIGIVMAGLVGCGGPSQEEYDQLAAEYESLSQLTSQLRTDFDELTEQYDKLQEEKTTLEQEYQAFQEFVYPYYEYIQSLQSQQSAQSQEEQLYQIAQTYETGITYEDLTQRPEEYVGQKFRYPGTIMGGNVADGNLNLLVAIDGDEEQLLLMAGSADWSGGISEGMTVTVYGTSGGLMEYTDEDGEELQIPGASLDYIVQG